MQPCPTVCYYYRCLCLSLQRGVPLGRSIDLEITNLNDEPFSGPINLVHPANHRRAHGRARASPNPPLTKGLPNRFGESGSATLGSEIADFPSSASDTCNPYLYLYPDPDHPSRPSSTSSKQLLFSSSGPQTYRPPTLAHQDFAFLRFLAQFDPRPFLSLLASRSSVENCFQVSYDITTSLTGLLHPAFSPPPFSCNASDRPRLPTDIKSLFLVGPLFPACESSISPFLLPTTAYLILPQYSIIQAVDFHSIVSPHHCNWPA